MRDFYATMAQVFPLLMLALIWESSFLDKLAVQSRALRKDDPVSGVRFWTKPRARNWTIFVVVVAVFGLGSAALALAGVVPDILPLRIGILSGLGIILCTLLTRAIADTVIAARQ